MACIWMFSSCFTTLGTFLDSPCQRLNAFVYKIVAWLESILKRLGEYVNTNQSLLHEEVVKIYLLCHKLPRLSSPIMIYSKVTVCAVAWEQTAGFHNQQIKHWLLKDCSRCFTYLQSKLVIMRALQFVYTLGLENSLLSLTDGGVLGSYLVSHKVLQMLNPLLTVETLGSIARRKKTFVLWSVWLRKLPSGLTNPACIALISAGSILLHGPGGEFDLFGFWI